MEETIIDYYMHLPMHLHFVHIVEQSIKNDNFYRLLSEYGSGTVRILNLRNQILILFADFTPCTDFEKVSEIQEDFLEISQFETNFSSFKIGKRKVQQVDRGICCYANSQKIAYAFCEAGKPTRFTKIIITHDYFDHFLSDRIGDAYSSSKDSFRFLEQNPNSPELNFLFQQIKDCPAKGSALDLYMEGKVLELLSLVTHMKELFATHKHISVKLDAKDKRSLGKIVTLMKNKLSDYPSLELLAQTAGMSLSRFQMAFKQVYGTTPYEYLRIMRMNYALLLLRDSDDNIKTVALKVGYHNAGHFSKLFKNIFGMGPQEYRNTHGIK